VGEVPARGEDSYNTVVPTLADSTETGNHYSVYFVSAVTADTFVYYDSEPDSGYSVDNLAPNPPESFRLVTVTGDGDVELAWDESEAMDFRYFALYRGTDPGFVPGEPNRIAQLTEISYTDVDVVSIGAPMLYYKISAFDFAGNESDFAPTSTVVVGIEPGEVMPGRIALYPSIPNPVTGQAVIRFDLAVRTPVALTIISAQGRIVRRAIDGDELPAGKHEWVWDGRSDSGVRLPAGVYFARLQTPLASLNRKIVVLD
jgi:hypothetical protein